MLEPIPFLFGNLVVPFGSYALKSPLVVGKATAHNASECVQTTL